MNKSNKHRRSWWQNISTSSKVFCIVGIVIASVILLTYYFVSMASGPEVVAKVVIAVSILGIIIFIVTYMICSATDRASLNVFHGATVELLRKMILQEDAKIRQLYDQDDWWEEIDLDMEPEERLAKTVKPAINEQDLKCMSEEELTALWAEINSFNYEAEMEEIRQRRLKREIERMKERAERIKATNPDEAAKIEAEIAIILQAEKSTFMVAKSAVKAEDESKLKTAEDENEAEPKGKPVEASGDDKHEDPPIVPVKEAGQPNNNVVAQFVQGEHTGEFDVITINGIIHGGSKEQPVKEENSAEGQPPTFMQQLQLEGMIPPDSPEKQPEEPQEQPKVWPSVEEQAEELGIPSDLLRFWLHGKEHISQLSFAEQEKIKKKAKMLA